MMNILLASVIPIASCFALEPIPSTPSRTPTVDLGHEVYRGVYDSDYDLEIYKGVRYAAPPIGKQRWQMPQPYRSNGTQVLDAIYDPPRCPQSLPVPMPPGYNFTENILGNEDCLFLNVYAPSNKNHLPVLVWIHGGGYGIRSAKDFDFRAPIRTANNSYIAVVIQYRLGAFGFLSSAEVAEFGTVNVGLHDMRFALSFVRKYISVFGGDPNRVTVGGVSAGAGATMLLSMANTPDEDYSLFNGMIASSPFLPTQWDYDGAWPTEAYHKFAEEVGCSKNESPSDSSVFECLQAADSIVLQNASNIVSGSGLYMQWPFVPVTDGTLIQNRPTTQLLGNASELHGMRILTSNNLNEGPAFTPQNITDRDAFINLLQNNYPLLTPENITSILALYAVPDNFTGPFINSDGINPPFSTTTSNYAIGWQQAAINLYAEATFVCPSYWLADAFSKKDGGSAWKYQFSPAPAYHGADLEVFISPPDTNGTGINEIFRTEMQKIWGNFIVNGQPMPTTTGNDSRSDWIPWGERGQYHQLNMNMTGGVPIITPTVYDGKTIPVISYVPGNDSSSPPLVAEFEVVDAMSWEGGRGERCQLWADLGPWIQE